MIDRRTVHPLLILPIVVAMVCGSCKSSTNASANPANVQPSPTTAESGASHAIETETVTPQPIAGMISATGKILVPEDRIAVIGPVNQGRLVRLYAGQGSRVRKGQKLAELESADIDQAESDYLKALADAENARRSSAAEIKLAQE